MNRNQDFDETVATWLNEGADRAPERFVWAALEDMERTAQRGASRASLEKLTMQFKFAAPVVGVAAVVALALAAYQLFGTPNVGNPGVTPHVLTADDLRSIIVTESNVPASLIVARTLTGVEALEVSETAPGDSAGFIDAVLTDLHWDGHPETDLVRYGTFAAVFETVADAERAYEAAVANHESPDGWGLHRSSDLRYDPDPKLGDESVLLIDRMAYGHPEVAAYLWREDNVLLHAVGFWLYWSPEQLPSIAEGMDERAP